MTDHIEPVLSAKEWEREAATLATSAEVIRIMRTENGVRLVVAEPGHEVQVVNSPARLRKVIALANAALPDSDPRKITWEMVDDLRREADRAEYADRVGDNAGMTNLDARRIADALASYLQPVQVVRPAI